MKRIIIICEGQTEQSFCKDVLAPYFLSKNILVYHPIIKDSKGGIVGWQVLKREIEGYLKNDVGAIITTLIDFYGINDKHQFPLWQDAKKVLDKNHRISKLEDAMKTEIHENLRYRFIPYFQLHEFEALLLNRIDVFKNNFSESKANFIELANIIDQYPNPELINDGKDSAPSVRLANLIKGYKKVVYGAILAHEIGLVNIRSKCPRFNGWIETLETK